MNFILSKNKMIIKKMFTDQIGRYFAIFIFAPILILKGVAKSDNLLLILGIALFLWDLYWILFREPKVSVHSFDFSEKKIEQEEIIMIDGKLISRGG